MKQNSEREECAHVSVFEPRPNRSMELDTDNEYNWPLFCGQYLLGHRFYLEGVAEDPYTLLNPALVCSLARVQEQTRKHTLPVAFLDRYYRPFLAMLLATSIDL